MGPYELIDRKSIPDSDGFYTEYSWYVNTETGMHVMVFGDSDLYKPEDENFDAEFETQDEAQEWFNNYNGFEDEEESFHEDIDTQVVDESTQVASRPTSRFMYKGYICDKCEDGFKIFTVTEWQFGKGLRLSETTVADEEAARQWIDNTLMGGVGVADSSNLTMDPVSESKITESSSYNDMYFELHDCIETVAKKWIQYIKDKAEFAELVGKVADDVFESLATEETTNSSSVGQHKSGSIDLIEGAKLEKRQPIRHGRARR